MNEDAQTAVDQALETPLPIGAKLVLVTIAADAQREDLGEDMYDRLQRRTGLNYAELSTAIRLLTLHRFIHRTHAERQRPFRLGGLIKHGVEHKR